MPFFIFILRWQILTFIKIFQKYYQESKNFPASFCHCLLKRESNIDESNIPWMAVAVLHFEIHLAFLRIYYLLLKINKIKKLLYL